MSLPLRSQSTAITPYIRGFLMWYIALWNLSFFYQFYLVLGRPHRAAETFPLYLMFQFFSEEIGSILTNSPWSLICLKPGTHCLLVHTVPPPHQNIPPLAETADQKSVDCWFSQHACPTEARQTNKHMGCNSLSKFNAPKSTFLHQWAVDLQNTFSENHFSAPKFSHTIMHSPELCDS